MAFNPEYHRQSTRLRGYDYSSGGAYFLTLCTYQREWLFGEVLEGEMVLSDFGKIAQEEWLRSSKIRPDFELDAFIVMPNHVHGIVFIHRLPSVGAHRVRPNSPARSLGRDPNSIGALVAGFKSAVTKRINTARATPNHPVWQRNYHDQIIRGETQLEQTRTYLENNPRAWPQNEENPALLTPGITV